MKRTFSLSEISRHRAWLFGFAAAWILFHHFRFPFPDGAAFAPLIWLRDRGDCGVDIFVLLSAMGLYRSMEKDSSVLRFWLRRLERVLLPSLILVSVHYGLRSTSAVQYLKKFAVIPFWYIPFILSMYLIYPAIYRLQQKSRLFLPVLLTLSVIVPPVLHPLTDGLLVPWQREIPRVTAFLTGCLLAPMVRRGKKIRLWWLAALPAGFLLTDALPLWPVNLCSRIFLAAFVILALTLCAGCLVRCMAGRAVYRVFAFLGGLSLELYLLQPRVYSWLSELPLYATGRNSLYKLEIVNTLLTLLLAVVLRGLCDAIAGRFRKTALPETKEQNNGSSSV